MKRLEGTFASFDGTELYYRVFLHSPDADWMIALHGHGEHIGRYEKFAAELKEERLNLAFYDQRGYGRSGGGDVYVENLEDFVRDFSAFCDFLKQNHALPNKFYLFAHSLGALVGIRWVQKFPERIRALILSSPCFGLCLSSWLRVLIAWLDRIIPKFVLKNPVYPPHLTHNVQEIEIYRNDKFIKRRISVRLLHEMMRGTREIQRQAVFTFPFPVWVIMAGLEKIVDPKATLQFYEKLRVPAKDIKIFSDFYHEVFNELGQAEAFEILREYIRRSRNAGY